MKSERKIIKSVHWLLNEFSDENRVEKDKHPHTRYFYRGESDYTGKYGAENKLQPKLLRDEARLDHFMSLYSCSKENCVVKLQQSMLERFRRYASSQNIGESRYPAIGGSPTLDEWLCIAQHHGLPTLLLDWSLQPLIALYFTVDDESKHEKPGRLWFMKLKNREDRKDTTVRLRDNSGQKNGILIKVNKSDASRKNEESDGEAHNEKETRNKVDSPRIIVPWVFNNRIDSQHARFTYSGKNNIGKGLEEINTKDDSCPWSKLDWFEVPAKHKKEIKNQLEKLQIHEKTLFPDLDGLAKYLDGGGI